MSTNVMFAEAARMKIIQKVGKRRAVVIPRELCEQVGLEEGDFIELQAVDGTVVIKPQQVVDRRGVANQREFVTHQPPR